MHTQDAVAGTDARAVNDSLANGVFHIELNRPEAGNAANMLLAMQLLEAVQKMQRSADVRVLLISAAGRNFMAGGDLAGVRENPAKMMALVATVNQVVTALAECPIPIVCAAQGLVAGGGLGLALSADILIAEEGARFTVGSPAIGMSPDAGTTWQLARWVGMRRAMEMGLLCTTVDAQAALGCGLISEIAPKGSLMELAQSRARQLAAGAHVALQQTKRLLKSASQNDLKAQIEEEGRALSLCMKSPDFVEGITSLMEKRKPLFS